MKKIFLVLAMVLIAGVLVAQTNADDIMGEWLSAKKDSRVLIYKDGSSYYGKITWGSGTAVKDVKNPKTVLRSRDLIGLVILEGFVFDGDDGWEGGSIYDPREGKTYSCKMKLKNTSTLSIRGYIGISLFGRTEVWTRYK